MPFVLDASTALSLVLEDEKALFKSMSEWTLALMAKDSAIVPPIFWSEIGNALVVNRRRSRLDHQQMLAYFSQLQRLPITVVSPIVGESVLELAYQQQLSVYDATYLSLAITENLSLASVDAKLAEAAQRKNVEIIQPMVSMA